MTNGDVLRSVRFLARRRRYLDQQLAEIDDPAKRVPFMLKERDSLNVLLEVACDRLLVEGFPPGVVKEAAS